MDILVVLVLLWLASKWCARNEEHMQEIKRKKKFSIYQSLKVN